MPLRTIPRAELLRRLRPYGCRKVLDVGYENRELWETGWLRPFSLRHQDGRYTERQYFNILFYTIDKTMPPGWTFIEDDDGA